MSVVGGHTPQSYASQIKPPAYRAPPGSDFKPSLCLKGVSYPSCLCKDGALGWWAGGGPDLEKEQKKEKRICKRVLGRENSKITLQIMIPC